MNTNHWEHFEHQADIGVRGFGDSLPEAFEQAAYALTSVITDLSLISNDIAINIECHEEDRELLLVDWLNQIIYQMATRKMLFGRFTVNIENGTLRATAWGETMNIERHQPSVEIKGATYTALCVQQTAHGWMAQCVVDV